MLTRARIISVSQMIAAIEFSFKNCQYNVLYVVMKWKLYKEIAQQVSAIIYCTLGKGAQTSCWTLSSWTFYKVTLWNGDGVLIRGLDLSTFMKKKFARPLNLREIRMCENQCKNKFYKDDIEQLIYRTTINCLFLSIMKHLHFRYLKENI